MGQKQKKSPKKRNRKDNGGKKGVKHLK